MARAARTPSASAASTSAPSGGEPVERCSVCAQPVVAIEMTVDGRPLEMRSCDNCDTRSWNLAGDPIALDGVLTQVGQLAGRRRR